MHPTVKPIKLMEYLIDLTTNAGDVILDPFMGSGTTGIAAKNLRREFIGIEISPEYFKIAQQRIEAWQPPTQHEMFD
jgi:site-specific DNA-methyltransferase (adenine-specific)